MTDRYEDLADHLALEEQAALTAGEDDWHSQGLPERGVPRLKVTDGPVGARGESYTTTTSALFPCGSALGATFDPDLVERVGAAIADEARTKAAHVLLGPTINLIRHPLGGRNFEAYSEDPALTARLAVAFVRGVQSRGVAACVKHFVANDAEIERHTISSDVDERTLREVYLRPFEAAVRDGTVWTVMASYNRINGTFGCEHPWLLSTVLQGGVGLRRARDVGLVRHPRHGGGRPRRARPRDAGTRTALRGPAGHRGRSRRGPAPRGCRAGSSAAAAPRPGGRRPRRAPRRPPSTMPTDGGWRGRPRPHPWSSSATPTSPGERVLPLDPGALQRVAVIGPNAATAVVQGGGSARVTPHRTVSPLAGLRDRLGDRVTVEYEPGALRGQVPVLDGRHARTIAGPGIAMSYAAEADGEVLFANTVPSLDAVWSGRFAPGVDPRHFHLRAEATVVADRSGPHVLSATSIGPCQVLLDHEPVLDTASAGRGQSFFGFGTEEVRTTVDLTAGRSYDLAVTYQRPARHPIAGLRVGLQPPLGDDPIAAAAAAAERADAAVVVVGTDEVEETEGHDRRTLSLGAEQDELVRRVAAANPRTVVVVNAGSAVDMPWADDVAAIVQLWFPGMAGGEALARVLVGDDEPGGRLPFTVPVDLADAPCDIAAADPPGHLRYTEGLAVGHRWYLDQGIEPRWWFGAGEGYGRFEWGAASAATPWSPGAPLAVSVPVTNTGPRRGGEVVQAYVARPASSVERPTWVFAGSTKQTVEPGATVAVEVSLDPAVLRHWDPVEGWVVEPGPLEVRIARHAGDPGQTITVDIT